MDSNNRVGYGRPPKHSQFKPGQSGNPAGRKPKPTALIEKSARILSEPVKTRDKSGRKRTLRMMEASYLALCREALNGDRSALLNVMRTLLIVGPEIDDASSEWNAYVQSSLIEGYQKMGFSVDEIEHLLNSRSTSRRT
ncbi:DUF5681 domain-containing protein [Maricaulaceae bacterium NA33B04]|nr:DUF5681 domain-containing protein [Maricaulaceae bacterium NA33B04]